MFVSLKFLASRHGWHHLAIMSLRQHDLYSCHPQPWEILRCTRAFSRASFPDNWTESDIGPAFMTSRVNDIFFFNAERTREENTAWLNVFNVSTGEWGWIHPGTVEHVTGTVKVTQQHLLRNEWSCVDCACLNARPADLRHIGSCEESFRVLVRCKMFSEVLLEICLLLLLHGHVTLHCPGGKHRSWGMAWTISILCPSVRMETFRQRWCNVCGDPRFSESCLRLAVRDVFSQR